MGISYHVAALPAENGLDLVDGSGFVTSSGLPMSKSALAASFWRTLMDKRFDAPREAG